MPTWGGSELGEFMVRSPGGGCVVDDRWIVVRSTAVSGSYGLGHFAVVDTDAGGASRSFNGLSTAVFSSTGTPTLVAVGGKAWTNNGNNPAPLTSIDPASGLITSTGVSRFANCMTSIGSVIYGTNGLNNWFWGMNVSPVSSLFNLSSTNAGGSCIASYGSRLFTIAGTTIRERNPTTGVATGASWTLPFAVGDQQSAQVRGTDLILYGTAGAWSTFDAATDTPGGIITTPSGCPTIANSRAWTIGPDGYIYQVDTGALTMTVIDPDSGRWATRDLPTVRSDRHRLFVAGGELWLPTGEPHL